MTKYVEINVEPQDLHITLCECDYSVGCNKRDLEKLFLPFKEREYIEFSIEGIRAFYL